LASHGVLGSPSEYLDRRWSARRLPAFRSRTEVRFHPAGRRIADPSRSHADLQSIEPRAVAAGWASRLRLRHLGLALACSRSWSPRPCYRSGTLPSWPCTSHRDRPPGSARAPAGGRAPAG